MKYPRLKILMTMMCIISMLAYAHPVISQAAYLDSVFDGAIILGRADNTSITASITANGGSRVYLSWGVQSNVYTHKSVEAQASALKPAVVVMDGLEPGQAYYYRLFFAGEGGESYECTPEYSFRTPALTGESYRFVVQSDSHLLNKADKELYRQSMESMAAQNPDFMFDLGDTFLNDQGKDGQAPKYEQILSTYTQQLPFISIVARSAPLYLTIGNHEGENGFLLDGTSNNLAAMATRARTAFYPNPLPDEFYSGNAESEKGVGQPQNYYAFTWGDALYVSIDPYRYTTMEPYESKDGWGWTLGKEQYDWFRSTLENSTAKYKFVFAHHAIGNMRGGALIASLYEWGGYDRQGRYLFDQMRPGWGKPIQQIMKDTGVTIFFQGHDHLFARENVDGVIYQTLPKPAEKIADRQSNENSYPESDKLLNSGYLKVSVAPENVQVDYYRSYYVSSAPQEGNTGVVYSYTVDPEHRVEVLNGVSDDFSTYSSMEGSKKEPKAAKSAMGSGAGIWDEFKQWIYNTGCSVISLFAAAVPGAAETEPAAGKNGTAIEPISIDNAGGIILGCPSDDSILLKALAESDCEAYFEYGPAGTAFGASTVPHGYKEGDIIEAILQGLLPDTEYSYRMMMRTTAEAEYISKQAGTFHTERAAGESFKFTVQADSHRDENTNLELYQTTLDNIAAESPDFHIDLGDTFMGEKLAKTEETTIRRYLEDRGLFARIGGSVPLFLVNGNHEGECGWNMTRSGNDIAAWASRARLAYFPNPSPDGFYSGSLPGQGNYYAYNWGDALFIMLDPFWFSEKKARSSDDGWSYTLGREQYDWLKETLENSTSRYKFVFVHNLVGGYGKDARGGAEAARFFEWGGSNSDGSYGFDEMRPGWGKPIHQLLTENGVNAVFHGHDHFYARQELDGIIYQLVPQPGHPGNDVKNAASYSYMDGLFLPPAGHLLVAVSGQEVKVEYIESSSEAKLNGIADDSFLIK